MIILKAVLVITLYIIIGYVIESMYSYIKKEDVDEDDCLAFALMWPIGLIIYVGWIFIKLIKFISNKIVFVLILPIELIKAKKKIKNMEDTLKEGE